MYYHNGDPYYNLYHNLPNNQHEGIPDYYGTYPNYRNGYNPQYSSHGYGIGLRDYGANPFVVNINEATKQNHSYRTALWTGEHLQLTLMSLEPGEDIGLEMHPNVDQFLRIEQGQGIVQMGKSKENLNFKRNVSDDFAILIPAGTWHNLSNVGNIPLKLYSIYAPPNHPIGTVHATKAEAAEHANGLENGHQAVNENASNRQSPRYYWKM